MIYCGWDIGGAHLKVASVNINGDIVSANQFASPLWKGIDTLVDSLQKAINFLPRDEILHSVTTTAELADIFSNRHQGLLEINRHLLHTLGSEHFSFYAGREGLVPSSLFEKYTEKIASSNWHATASFVARNVNKGILIDIGSTTTDIIPFAGGEVLNLGSSDYERMQTNELVY